MNKVKEKVIILDSTIRDGNYSVDFKFNEFDTGFLTRELAKLGFKWIEIGHSLGLGAMQAGKGHMPATDVELIHSAKKNCKKAKIGMFFIPSLMSPNVAKELLKIAAKEGLDFIRIGNNITDVDKVICYIELARKYGMLPCINMMKSYAVEPKEFADKAKLAASAGAEVVYCVDSAGGMFPEDVEKYLDAARSKTNCRLGFHGHNNLMMGVANCITAYRHGARFIDTTFCGLGRSAGNVPTEILIAVFQRMGISTGIDLFKCMDTIEAYIWPLVSNVRPHDMIGVTAGYARFHSSYFSKILAAAQKHNAEVKRLTARVASHNPVNLDEKYLEDTARQMANSGGIKVSDALMSFNVPEISKQKVSYSQDAVGKLVKGLEVSSAKRFGTKPLLHLKASVDRNPGLLLPEYVMADTYMVLGRVIYGSLEDLEEVLKIASGSISLFLIDANFRWAKNSYSVAKKSIGTDRLLPVCEKDIMKLFLKEVLNSAAARYGSRSLLIYGFDSNISGLLEGDLNFDSIFLYPKPVHNSFKIRHGVVLNNTDELQNLEHSFDVVLCAISLSAQDARILAKAVSSAGRVICTSLFPGSGLEEVFQDKLLLLDSNLAFTGILARYLAIDQSLKRYGYQDKNEG